MPSPVITKSLFAISFARSKDSVTSSNPLTRFAPSAIRAKPIPPPAPAPSITAASFLSFLLGVFFASSSCFASSWSINSLLAPFCSPNPLAAPLFPSNKTSTSVAAISSTSFSFSLLTTSNIPRPASIEAVPPTPTNMVWQSSFKAILINSPMPREVYLSGVLGSLVINCGPTIK